MAKQRKKSNKERKMWNRQQSLGKARFALRVQTLNTVGNAGNVGQTIRSKKDKANDPRLQRKTRDWRKDID